MNREALGGRLASNGRERESSAAQVLREGKCCETERERRDRERQREKEETGDAWLVHKRLDFSREFFPLSPLSFLCFFFFLLCTFCFLLTLSVFFFFFSRNNPSLFLSPRSCPLLPQLQPRMQYLEKSPKATLIDHPLNAGRALAFKAGIRRRNLRPSSPEYASMHISKIMQCKSFLKA